MKQLQIAILLLIGGLTLNAQSTCPSTAGKWMVSFNGYQGSTLVGLRGKITVDSFGNVIPQNPATQFMGILQQQFWSTVLLYSGPDLLSQNVTDGSEWLPLPGFKQPVAGTLTQDANCNVTLVLSDSMPFSADGLIGNGLTFRLNWAVTPAGNTLAGGGKAYNLPAHTGQFFFLGGLSPSL